MPWAGVALVAWGAWLILWAPPLMTRYRDRLEESRQWAGPSRQYLTAREMRLAGALWLALGIWSLVAGV